MKKYLLQLPVITGAALMLSAALITSASNAQTAPPPSFGEETKGIPAVEESVSKSETNTSVSSDADAPSEKSQTSTVFGSATVIESRRESGQVYSIELQHSNAPSQYIEETDSDGNIEYKSNDLEETPNLPKWKLGSW